MKNLSKSNKVSFQTYILTLTRGCAQTCTFCAVDAYGGSIEKCIEMNNKMIKINKEMSCNEWLRVVDKILTKNENAHFDLSGGDCLIIPAIRNNFIPELMKRVKPEQVSITATADSLRIWIQELKLKHQNILPKSIHITYDGIRSYSFDNISLVKNLKNLGFDVHIECPLTIDNTSSECIKSIFKVAMENQISEILLMRYYPVGRGAVLNTVKINEPNSETYKKSINLYRELEELYQYKTRVKVQCSLKSFDELSGIYRCKIGDSTWCVMPNGNLLICPWAYGKQGNYLDPSFYAGNLLYESMEMCMENANIKRRNLIQMFLSECKIFGIVAEMDKGVVNE